MKPFHACSSFVRCGLLAALTLVAASPAFAENPLISWFGANRPCSVTVSSVLLSQTNKLVTVTNAYDGASWYVDATSNPAFFFEDYTLVATLPGYATSWRTYKTAPKSHFAEGPKAATETLATGTNLTLTASVMDTLGKLAGPSTWSLLYVYFTPITYSLTYDLDGGSWPKRATHPETATYEKAFTVTNPTKTGFSFAGWDVDGTNYPYSSGSSMTFKNLTTVEGTNVSFLAQWARVDCDLRLVVSEGVAQIWYRHEEEGGAWSAWRATAGTTTVSVPYGLKWEAYCETLPHWTYSGAGSSEENPSGGTKGMGETTFKPVPSRKTYKMNLTANPAAGGTVGTSEGGYTYQSESDAHLWATPQTGYKFSSWSDGSVQNPHAVTMLSDTNMWANFEKIVYTVTFAYRDENGTLKREEQSVAYGDSAQEPSAIKRNVNPGYVFENWNDNTWKTIKGNLDVNAEYTANSYTVKFVGNGATSGSEQEQSFTYGEEKKLKKCTFSRTGYTFAGWSTTVDATSSSRHYDDEESVQNIVTDSDGEARDTGATLVLYAQWTPITYKIRFVSNVGTGTMNDEIVSYDQAFTLPACAFESSSAFDHWTCSADGQDYTNCETVVRLASTEDATVTMTANWSGSPDRTVTFDANGGEGTMDPQSFAKNVEFSIFPNAFTKKGYIFAGWSTDSNVLLPDQSLVTTNASFTLSAVWQPITYQVVFDANNGTALTIVSNFTYGVNLPPTTAPAGFDPPAGLDAFVGWGTNTTAVLYKAGDPGINLSSINGDHIKLYAIWGLENCGDYSKALGCENLKWETDGDQWNILGAQVDYESDGFSAQLKAEVKKGTYILTYNWHPKASESILEVKLNNRPVSTETAIAPGWVSRSVEVIVSEAESGKLLKFIPGADCSFSNVCWTRVLTDPKSVTFDLNGGTRTRSEDCVYGGETNQVVETDHVALEPTVTPPAGQVLKQWKVGDETVLVDEVALRAITGDTTFTADYTNAVYKVIYANARGGEGFVNPNPKTFTAFKTETIRELQNADGETRATGFLGWALGRDQKIASTGDVTIPEGTTSNFVVTAVWDDQKVVTTNTVRFVTIEDGVAVTNDGVAVESGKNAPMPTPPGRAGYAFVGWDKSADAVTSDRTLTAQYELISYPISYHNTHGLVNGNRAYYANLPLSYTVEDEIELDTLKSEASVTYTKFIGWSLDGGATLTSGIAKGTTGELIFTAVWSNTVYAITYTGLEGATHSNPATYTCDDNIVFTDPAERQGYTFTGWTPARIEKGSYGDLTVAAGWIRQKHTVTIDGQSREVEFGEKLTETAPFVSVTNGLTNVVCVGWVGTGSVPASGTGTKVTFTVTEPSSLTWRYQTNYWVSATGRDQTIASTVDAIAPIASSKGGTVTLSDASGTLASTEGWFASGTNLTAVATPAHGWNFVRWLVDANFCSRQNEDESVLIGRDQTIASTYDFSVSSPVSLTAVFTANVYTVTFVLDERLTRIGGGALEQTVAHGGSATAPKVRAETGYVFAGWDLPFDSVTEDLVVTGSAEEAPTYPAGEQTVIDPPETTLSGTVTWSAKNLPAGLKIAAKDLQDRTYGALAGGTIYGTPTKPGTYLVKVTAKSGRQTETFDIEVTVGHYVDDELPLDESYTSTLGVKTLFELGEAFKGASVSGLPAGLKLAAKDLTDKTFGELAAGTVYGSPTKAVTNTVTFTKKIDGVTHKASATFAVAALPAWAVGTFNGQLEDGSGSATLTVGTTGKASGKVIAGGKTWTFSATGYEEGPGEGDEAAFTLVATVKSGKLSAEIALVVTGDGASGTISGDDYDELELCNDLTLWRNEWKDKGATAKLAPWVGLYTVQLEGTDTGFGYLSLTLDAKGNCKATGKLPDGTSASATLPLVWDDEAEAPLAIWQVAPSAYKGGYVGGLLQWERGEVTGDGIAWVSYAPTASSEYGAGFDRFLSANGAYYNKLATLADYYETLAFSAEAPVLDATVKTTEIDETTGRKVTTSELTEVDAVEPDCWGSLTVSLDAKGTAFVVDQGKATKPVKVDGEWTYEGANDAALTLSFTKATGIFKGSFTCWYDYLSAEDLTKDPAKETWTHTSKKVSYEGIVVLGDADEAEPLRAYYLWDRTGSYEDETTGKEKTFKYKESRAVVFE